MKVDVGKIALVAVMIAGIQTSVLYHRIDDLECQRDIYKSRYEDWEGVSKEIAEYADTLRDSLKARDRLDGKLLVEDAGDFLCTAYCTEKREHICGTGTGITASGAPVEADVTVAADPDVFPFGTVLYIEDVGVRQHECRRSTFHYGRRLREVLRVCGTVRTRKEAHAVWHLITPQSPVTPGI